MVDRLIPPHDGTLIDLLADEDCAIEVKELSKNLLKYLILMNHLRMQKLLLILQFNT